MVLSFSKALWWNLLNRMTRTEEMYEAITEANSSIIGNLFSKSLFGFKTIASVFHFVIETVIFTELNIKTWNSLSWVQAELSFMDGKT